MTEYTKDQTAALREAIRSQASAMTAEADPGQLQRMDAAELMKALARMVEGKSLHDSFGAPGSWGYDTPIGAALAKLYRTPRAVAVPSLDPDCEISDADPGL